MTKVYWGRNGGVVVRRDKRGKFARRGTKTLLALIVVGFLVFGIIAPRVNVKLDHELVATGTTLNNWLIKKCAPEILVQIKGPKGFVEDVQYKRTHGGDDTCMSKDQMNEYMDK